VEQNSLAKIAAAMERNALGRDDDDYLEDHHYSDRYSSHSERYGRSRSRSRGSVSSYDSRSDEHDGKRSNRNGNDDDDGSIYLDAD
jgi:hypothetical protein